MRRDLRRLPREDRTGGLAQLAIELARTLDMIGKVPVGLRDLAAISAQFHAVMLTLSKRQEPPAVEDPIDELAKARAARLSDAAG